MEFILRSKAYIYRHEIGIQFMDTNSDATDNKTTRCIVYQVKPDFDFLSFTEIISDALNKSNLPCYPGGMSFNGNESKFCTELPRIIIHHFQTTKYGTKIKTTNTSAYMNKHHRDLLYKIFIDLKTICDNSDYDSFF